MTRTTLFGGAALAALAIAAASSPPAAAEGREPYRIVVSGLAAGKAGGLLEALGRLEGAEKVTASEDGATVTVATKEGAFLSEVHATRLVSEAGATVKEFREPAWAKVTVHVFEASGGG